VRRERSTWASIRFQNDSISGGFFAGRISALECAVPAPVGYDRPATHERNVAGATFR
jgi:hypothetical protein